jgi:hypothetical protein
MRVANVLFAALFLFSVIVQVNDPDPIRWMAIYGAAMGACIARGRAPWWVMAIIGGIAILWALTLAPGVFSEAELADLVRTMKHENHAEEAREMSGLLIVAAWMAALLWDARRVTPPA